MDKDTAITSLRNLRAKAEEKAAAVLATVETTGSAFALGYLRGMWEKDGEKFEVFGMDPELALGSLGVVASMTSIFGKQSEHIQAIANGAMAAWAYREGMRLGEEAATEK